MLEQGKDYHPSPGAGTETRCDELTMALIPCLPVMMGGRMESPGKKGRGGNVFKISTSHHPALILIGN